jgi:hypothetical protein
VSAPRPDTLLLMRDLRRRGVLLWATAGRLRVRAPVGTLTPGDRAALAGWRDALVAALTTHPCTNCGRYRFARPTLCYWCREGRR